MRKYKIRKEVEAIRFDNSEAWHGFLLSLSREWATVVIGLESTKITYETESLEYKDITVRPGEWLVKADGQYSVVTHEEFAKQGVSGLPIELSFDRDDNPCIKMRHYDKENSLGSIVMGQFIKAAKKGLVLENPSGHLGPDGSWENYEIRVK